MGSSSTEWCCTLDFIFYYVCIELGVIMDIYGGVWNTLDKLRMKGYPLEYLRLTAIVIDFWKIE
jgi:hypothetical protein